MAALLRAAHAATFAARTAVVIGATSGIGEGLCAAPPTFSGRTAVVVGATSGIGEGCALRLAEAGFKVVAVGRDATRGAAVVEAMAKRGGGGHEFVGCDSFSLGDVKGCAEKLREAHPKVDVLVLTQGMATIQGFTPTAEGNDEKLTLHYWSRMAWATQMLPSLRLGTETRVVSVLSAGVHSPYAHYREDPELREGYSIKNAADIAGFYNDLGLDALARQPLNADIAFVHACPGFVNTNWGTEMPWYVRFAVRLLQPLGRSAATCAEAMLHPVFKTTADLREEFGDGVVLMGKDAAPVAKTRMHTPENVEHVWSVTKAVLKRAGLTTLT
ncbi:hypothetical protein M885DRAFT_481333 [Pelagophyceae sp. CCMP2097]|nr:hypothetical protein M885DRAFT_481333 [Pelagophyceae sp. CCMP2097]|mmetsp:Transcript_31744/g.106968  ORF Transcript_31744/g.106968 Transcript_31744/m.106968 type:complete len:329 (-) Transcript_31744:54-1040(-)|eukprot:CAMPEP_0184086550 /NCGR_PEP_ID=MMETSP0974-20121125/5270_1 /TAXON_ID=483370 /ORGANISM="non described non described, Strain CCMP2097" /LENGTH=328 /DNA_ID=CAMNT_0026389241 /DNA_START=54 /DNA_END=1040 /DNA_ORIENTATION=-